ASVGLGAATSVSVVPAPRIWLVPWSRNTSSDAVVAKLLLALNTLTAISCGAPSLSTAANGVRSTRYGVKFSVWTLGIGRQSSGSMPPVKIHGKIGATPAGRPATGGPAPRKTGGPPARHAPAPPSRPRGRPHY